MYKAGPHTYILEKIPYILLQIRVRKYNLIFFLSTYG